MANSYSVVSIDQTHFDNRLSNRRVSRANLKKKLYTHTTKDALNPRQIDRLIQAALNSSRNGPRDAALILLAYKHGFKVSELRNLKWEHIDFENQSILVSRLSNGHETLHALAQAELALLYKLEKQNNKLVFKTQRNNKMSSTHIRRIIKQAGEEAGFKQPVSPSMITGSSGFEFASSAFRDRITKH
jgi:type 1 fimbriae regulatory protein FimE